MSQQQGFQVLHPIVYSAVYFITPIEYCTFDRRTIRTLDQQLFLSIIFIARMLDTLKVPLLVDRLEGLILRVFGALEICIILQKSAMGKYFQSAKN